MKQQMQPVTNQEHQGHDHTGMTSGHASHSAHRWMMIACCIPMLIVAVALVVTGVLSARFLIFAVACTAMMALMMGGMHSESKQ